MLPHNFELGPIQLSGFIQNGIRYGHLADIVQERTARDHANLIRRQTHGLRDCDRESRHPLGVAFGFTVFQVKGIAKRF